MTFRVSHVEMSWLNAVTFLNIAVINVTLDVFQPVRGAKLVPGEPPLLNKVAPSNISAIVVTPETFH